MKKLRILSVLLAAIFAASCSRAQQTSQPAWAAEQHRPQFHFSPKAHWMNDPNGMVYLNGIYHLFFQYNPGGTTWGPMHWGHAVSKDLMHWQELPIALYPDSLGTIFSGSAVVDKDNTAGFGKNAIVAIFTHHNKAIEDAKTGIHQYQSIAYSTDEGKTWTKYKGNPVLPNPGIWDFRDPKVQWYEAGKKWVMTLATKDRITFYSSPDLKKWTKESEFGEQLGAHGGVWECPDLFSLNYKGKQKWVLLVSINPGGPNGGSATQYFIGSFDGKTFKPDNTSTRWVDYGPDNYAGVTWSNTGNRKIFLGWMSNWDYAERVPTKNWRSANTIPRELKLVDEKGTLQLASVPVKEVDAITDDTKVLKNITIKDNYDLGDQFSELGGKYIIDITTATAKSFALNLTNTKGEALVIGYNNANNTYYIDRAKAGDVSFAPNFARKITAPRISSARQVSLKIVVDVASAEVFADDGKTVLTTVFFPTDILNRLQIKSEGLNINKLQYSAIHSTLQ